MRILQQESKHLKQTQLTSLHRMHFYLNRICEYPSFLRIMPIMRLPIFFFSDSKFSFIFLFFDIYRTLKNEIYKSKSLPLKMTLIKESQLFSFKHIYQIHKPFQLIPTRILKTMSTMSCNIQLTIHIQIKGKFTKRTICQSHDFL